MSRKPRLAQRQAFYRVVSGFRLRVRVRLLIGYLFPFLSFEQEMPASKRSASYHNDSYEHESKTLIVPDLIEETFRLSLWPVQW